MRVTSQQLKNFQNCRASLTADVDQPSLQDSLLAKTIRKVFTYTLQYSKQMSIRSVQSYWDNLCKENRLSFDDALAGWLIIEEIYGQLYWPNELHIIGVDFEAGIHLNGIDLLSHYDILLADNAGQAQIIQIEDIPTEFQLYTSLASKAEILILKDNNINIVKKISISLHSRGPNSANNSSIKELSISDTYLDISRRTLSSIANDIRYGILYPSASSHCKECSIYLANKQAQCWY